MARRIESGSSFPERMEKHADKTWHDMSFNHKTTLTMGLLVPLATKETYPGETWKLQCEINMRFAALNLPIMHQCYFTLDWYYVSNSVLWDVSPLNSWEIFISQDPVTGTLTWPWFSYSLAMGYKTRGILNYMGFNRPPDAGVFISVTTVSVLPPAAYAKIWDEYYRNDQIQNKIWIPIDSGNNTTAITTMLPDLLCLRRNWPRDYYTSATPTPQQGENILIPSFETDPETGLYIPQKTFWLDGDIPTNQSLITTGGMLATADSNSTVLQLSSTIRDFRYASQMTEYLERSMRAGDRYVDFVQRNFGYNPNPLYIDRPVWIGGYTGNVVISDVMATAEVGEYTVGQYAGKALASDSSPVFTYTTPDYGFIISILTVYPKASYYSGLENMWRRETKMDYMWEQFALIGDQPLTNKEVWFSWYDADIEWNDEIFGYLPQYAQFKYSNDIVSGQMRNLWESFHLGRKFEASGDVILNSEFITCTPDVGRVFVVDAENNEDEIYVHAYNSMNVLRRLPKNGLPQL